MAPLVERRVLVMAGPFGAPRKGELKGEGYKNIDIESDKVNRPSCTMYLEAVEFQRTQRPLLSPQTRPWKRSKNEI